MISTKLDLWKNERRKKNHSHTHMIRNQRIFGSKNRDIEIWKFQRFFSIWSFTFKDLKSSGCYIGVYYECINNNNLKQQQQKLNDNLKLIFVVVVENFQLKQKAKQTY